MTRKLSRIVSIPRSLDHRQAALAVGAAVAIGIILVAVFAAGTPVAFEAEAGTHTGGVTTVASTSASAGSAIKFGASTPTPTPTPTPTASPTPSPASPSGEAMPTGDMPGWHQTMALDFNSPATTGTGAGSFKQVYAANWCGYTNGSGGTRKYTDDEVITAHGGLMDFYLHNGLGAAGIFTGASCSNTGITYGRYSVRYKATDATSYGGVVMFWPMGDIWGNGEIDYPEGDFGGTFNMFQHGIDCTDCSANVGYYLSKTSYANWHTATTEWTSAGTKYYLDGVLVKTVTVQVPRDQHRFTIQMSETSTPEVPGHYLLDWAVLYTAK